MRTRKLYEPRCRFKAKSDALGALPHLGVPGQNARPVNACGSMHDQGQLANVPNVARGAALVVPAGAHTCGSDTIQLWDDLELPTYSGCSFSAQWPCAQARPRRRRRAPVPLVRRLQLRFWRVLFRARYRPAA
jgi:hypothetical protein